MAKKDNTLMTSGPIWKNILMFAFPLVLGNLFQQLYNIVDTIIVGNVVGKEALAAVGASGSIIQLLIGFCIGVSAGAGVVMSQYYGAKNEKGVQKTVHTTIAISVIAGIILSVVGVLLTPTILRWMGTPEEVFDQATLYLQVFFGGISFGVIYNMTAGILNAVGNSRRSLIYLIIAAISNIILDVVFVYFLKMGVVGAAIATDASQLISCIFIIRFLRNSNESYKVHLRKVKLYDHLARRILSLGLPTGIQTVVIALSNVIVQAAINSFGADAMAGYASFNKIDGFAFLPILSIGMAATTFTGQNYGAMQPARIRRGLKVTVGMAAGYAAVVAVVMIFATPYLLQIFTRDQNVIDFGVEVMLYMYPFYWILAIFNTMSGTIRGVGKTFEAMIFSILSLCVVRVLWIFVVQSITHSLRLVLIGYPVTWVVASLMLFIYVKKVKWIDIEE